MADEVKAVPEVTPAPVVPEAKAATPKVDSDLGPEQQKVVDGVIAAEEEIIQVDNRTSVITSQFAGPLGMTCTKTEAEYGLPEGGKKGWGSVTQETCDNPETGAHSERTSVFTQSHYRPENEDYRLGESNTPEIEKVGDVGTVYTHSASSHDGVQTEYDEYIRTEVVREDAVKIEAYTVVKDNTHTSAPVEPEVELAVAAPPPPAPSM